MTVLHPEFSAWQNLRRVYSGRHHRGVDGLAAPWWTIATPLLGGYEPK